MNAAMGSRVIVTGGAGFIGSHLVGALVAHGSDVMVIDDLSKGHPDWVADDVRIEVADVPTADLSRSFAGWRPTTVSASRPRRACLLR